MVAQANHDVDAIRAAVVAEIKRVSPFEFDEKGRVTNPDVLKDQDEDDPLVKGVSINITMDDDGTYECDIALCEDFSKTIWIFFGSERDRELHERMWTDLLSLDEYEVDKVVSTFVGEGWIEIED